MPPGCHHRCSSDHAVVGPSGRPLVVARRRGGVGGGPGSVEDSVEDSVEGSVEQLGDMVACWWKKWLPWKWCGVM